MLDGGLSTLSLLVFLATLAQRTTAMSEVTLGVLEESVTLGDFCSYIMARMGQGFAQESRGEESLDGSREVNHNC